MKSTHNRRHILCDAKNKWNSWMVWLMVQRQQRILFFLFAAICLKFWLWFLVLCDFYGVKTFRPKRFAKTKNSYIHRAEWASVSKLFVGQLSILARMSIAANKAELISSLSLPRATTIHKFHLLFEPYSIQNKHIYKHLPTMTDQVL